MTGKYSLIYADPPWSYGNAIRAACRRCTEEIQQPMRKKPKPNWNETVPPIINKHHKKIEALGVSLLELVVKTGRLNGRFGAEQ